MLWIRKTVLLYCNGWYTLCTVHAEKILYQLVLHELAKNLDLLLLALYSTWTTRQYLERVQNPRLDCSIYFILKDTSTHIYSLFLANKCTKIYTLNEKKN